MTRLGRYLARLFWADAMALFAVAAFLLFLVQCLRLFDLVATKSQGLPTLIGQALLSMPSLGIAFLYVCLGIGLGRTLRNLEATGQLQIIHANRLLPALLRAIGGYAVGGTLLVLLLSHIVEPLSVRHNQQWAASIAADLVGRALTPHRFSEVASGVTVMIGGRGRDGELYEFFANDSRAPDSRRTYLAKSALLSEDSEGYVLQLKEGVLQYLGADNAYSEVSFNRYDLALEALTGPQGTGVGKERQSSLDYTAEAIAAGGWSHEGAEAVAARSVEGLRVLALCLIVVALAAFPSGERRPRQIPIEVSVLAIAFAERAVSSYVVLPGIWATASGSLLLLGLGGVLLARRLRLFISMPAIGAVA